MWKIRRTRLDRNKEILDDSIVITAQGPNLPNLTFIDLPGLVRKVKDGEDQSINGRISSVLKTTYLYQSRTIIL